MCTCGLFIYQRVRGKEMLNSSRGKTGGGRRYARTAHVWLEECLNPESPDEVAISSAVRSVTASESDTACVCVSVSSSGIYICMGPHNSARNRINCCSPNSPHTHASMQAHAYMHLHTCTCTHVHTYLKLCQQPLELLTAEQFCVPVRHRCRGRASGSCT